MPSYNTIDGINDSVLHTGFPVPHPSLRPHRIVPYEERWLTGNLPMVIGRTPNINWRAYNRHQLSSAIDSNIARMRANRHATSAATTRPGRRPLHPLHTEIHYPAGRINTHPVVVRFNPRATR